MGIVLIILGALALAASGQVTAHTLPTHGLVLPTAQSSTNHLYPIVPIVKFKTPQVQEYSLEKPYNMEREDSKNNPVDPGSGCCRSNCDTADWEDHNPCYLKLTVTEDMPSPAYVYYKLENFHQNHRFYVKSRSWNQLRVIATPFFL